MSKHHDQREEEVQSNDWQDFVATWSGIWDRWGHVFLSAVIVVLIAVFAYRLYSSRQADQREFAWVNLSSATTPASMAEIASQNKGTAVGYIAALRAGALYMADASQADSTPPTTQPGAAVKPSKELSLSQAAAMYTSVDSDPSADLLFRLNARLGLAGVEETRGNYGKAREYYESVVKDGAAQYPMLVTQAKAMLEFVPTLGQKLVYAPEPIAAPGAGVLAPSAGNPSAPKTAPAPATAPVAPKAPATQPAAK